MATTKKVTAKKAPAKAAKAAPAKKVTAKASVGRAVRKSVKMSEPNLKSFRVAKDYPSFTTFKITKQTVYWVLLVAFIIFVQLWIIKLQIEVSSVIDEQQASLQSDN